MNALMLSALLVIQWINPTTNEDGTPFDAATQLNGTWLDCSPLPPTPTSWVLISSVPGAATTMSVDVPSTYRYCAIHQQTKSTSTPPSVWGDYARVFDLRAPAPPNNITVTPSP